MATEYVYFMGKAKWARLVQPDSSFNKWSIVVYPNEESLNQFRDLKVKNYLKKDDDGYFFQVSRPVQKLMRGKMTMFEPPAVFDKDSHLMDGKIVGNGSDVTVKCELYRYTPPGGKAKENALRLFSVRVDNLVPFEPKRDYDGAEQKAIVDAPTPTF